MNALQLDGILYDAVELTQLRQACIEVRDKRLGEGDFADAVMLSHVIVVLAHVIDNLEPNETD